MNRRLVRSVFQIGFPIGIVLAMFAARSVAAEAAARAYVPFEGEYGVWHDGFARYDFTMDARTLAITPIPSPARERFGVAAGSEDVRRCIVIRPKNPAPGNPWSWRGCYWDHQPQTEIELLRRGFSIAYVSADATLRPDRCWDAWYAFLTEKHGLSPKPVFIGMSRGGEFAFTWATLHPDRVAGIYADNPGMNDPAMSRLVDLARADVPLLLVCGTIDPLLQKNAMAIENLYHQFGGRVSVILKEGAGHHPHSLNDPTPIADFLERSARETPPPTPDFLSGRRFNRYSYYALDDTYSYFPRDGYWLTRRGPAFTPCFTRFEVPMGFAVPVNILAPHTDAPGRPWVFRANYVDRDATVDQALLAKGFHIVTGPIDYNADGPSNAEWNQVYEFLTAHGFSRKPILEGSGGAAGAVCEWAIRNPDKVSRIYVENPIFHTGGVRVQPLDDLAPLARAHIPILDMCGSQDPALESQTRVPEQRYRQLGGEITVIVEKGRGHFPSEPVVLKPVLDFILDRH